MSAYAGPKHPSCNCEGCPLYEEKYVPDFLVPDATIAAIGEAPGQQEAKQGVPFVGPSGQLLRQALNNAGLPWRISLMNAVACRPPQNRTPTPDEVSRCFPRVREALANSRVDQVLTLGNTATQALLETKEGITKMRAGMPKQLGDMEVVPTFHPAACLRVAQNFPNFLNDVKKLRKDLRVPWKEPEITIIDDPDEASMFLITLTDRDLEMVVDIEVGIEKDVDWGHSERYQWLCVGIQTEAGRPFVIGEEALRNNAVKWNLNRALETNRIICHNGKFDLAGLGVGKLYGDTMLASYVLDEQQGTHSLEYLGPEILGAPNWKNALKPYLGESKNYAVIPRDVLYKYNAMDVDVTFSLWEYYKRAMSPKQRQLHDTLAQRVSPMLMHCETAGVRIDEEYLHNMWEEQRKLLETLESGMQEIVANPRSPKQVKEALHDMGVRVASTNEKVLNVVRRKVTAEADTFITDLLEYRGQQKLESTYMRGVAKLVHEGRIHPSFLIHGTTTGRLSCKKPNIMNQPRGPRIRRMYIPDTPDHLWVQADYKTAELRVVAIEANDPYLIDVLSDNTRDIHGEVSNVYYGEGKWGKEERVRAKAVVYGLSYGREAGSIADEFGISMKEAERLIHQFFELIPATVAWRQEIKRRVFKDGWDPETHFGRIRRFHLITRENMRDVEKETYAFIPQSTSNDICLLAACELYEAGLDVRILVHDSILVQAQKDEAEATAATMARVMQEVAVKYYSDKVPFFVDTEIGTNWGMV